MTQTQALPNTGRFVYSIYRHLWSSLDLMFPPSCGGCRKPGSRWCSECNDKVDLISANCCQVCGQRLISPGICARCLTSKPTYNHLRSWAVFNNEIRNAIHKLKYQRDISMGEILSRPMIDILCKLPWMIDMVVPVPLSETRQKDRGYNQAAILAFPLALCLDLAYRPKALKRVRETASQVGLSYDQRQTNVSDAFMAEQKIVNKKRVLLVDDVATSGATLAACANALFIAGADEVNAVTLARALYN